MDERKTRIQLIRERHKKLILEPKQRIEYALREPWDEDPFLEDEEPVGVGVDVADTDEDE